MSEEITKGSIVMVESRTWPGSNKLGGVARVTAVHQNENETGTTSTTYDVSYVLGGKEKGVEEEYVRLQSSNETDDSAKKKRSSSGMNSTIASSISGGGNLHISTSTASLALSASPLQTPRSIDESTTKKEESPVNDNEEQVIEERRKRKNSIQEDILMGVSGSRNSSYNSLGVAAAKQDANDDMEQQQPPLVKKRKVETTEAEAETSHDDESAASSSALHNHHKTAIWSARKHLEIKDKKKSSNTNTTTATTENEEGKSTTTTTTSLKRWRSHQIAEDYISLASAMVLPPTITTNTQLNTFGYSPNLGQYPIEQVTALGYLTSPLRRPTVIEKWSPYEITTFEAALALHGKHFHQVQKWVKTKNTKEVIEFYYIWKKTSHYRRWKSSFCEEMEESVCSSDSGGEGEEDGMEVVEGKSE
mmetsp:Transcript_5998/g.8734  ORF Transcript_5998/g.8734 Transcript_5998/m.8734 type:complete len:419 (-) Transcript_5998:8-1264(-)